MPTYAYACSSCGHRFDIYQAFTDSALTECPECGGSLRKEFGNVGVVFKGAGFYRNDARKAASGEASGSTSTTSSSSTSSGAAKESSGSKDTASSSSSSSSTPSTSSTSSTSSPSKASSS